MHQQAHAWRGAWHALKCSNVFRHTHRHMITLLRGNACLRIGIPAHRLTCAWAQCGPRCRSNGVDWAFDALGQPMPPTSSNGLPCVGCPTCWRRHSGYRLVCCGGISAPPRRYSLRPYGAPALVTKVLTILMGSCSSLVALGCRSL